MSEKTRQKIEEISTRIQNLFLRSLKPGDRIPSEREIAEKLDETHNRVHRAIQLLIDNGILFSSGCRRGVFLLSGEYSTPTRHGELRKKILLRFHLPIDPKSQQMKQWHKVCEYFKLLHPQVEFEYLYGEMEPAVEADLYLTWPPLYNCSHYLPLNPEDLFSDDLSPRDLLPDILRIGAQYGRQYAIPVLHSPSVFWGHRNLLRRQNLKLSQFRDPLDFFKWGTELENTNQCAMGFTFYGFTYHAVQWGIDLERQNDQFRIEPDKLKIFLTEIEPLVKAPHLPYSPFNFYNYFHRGQLALLAGYLHSLPISENRFMLLGQPLRASGFACLGSFLLAIGRNTRHTAMAMAFIRFALTERMQRLQHYPEIKFSVRSDLYAEQYQTLKESFKVEIPPYDFRGSRFGTDLDFIHLGAYIYSECANFLCGFTHLELALSRLSLINIRQRRQDWLRSVSPKITRRYHSFISTFS